MVNALGPDAILNPAAAAASSAGGTAGAGKGATEASASSGGLLAGAIGLVWQLSSSAGLDDRERAVLLALKKLSVSAAKKSNVIEIAYRGPSARGCQAVVAKLIECYLDEHLRLNRAQGSLEFFAAQTKRLQEELAKKEGALRDLKSQTGLASPAAQRELLVVRIGRLEDDLLHAEADRAVAEAKVRELRGKRDSLPETEITNETSGYGNQGTDLMREQFYTLQLREKEGESKYTENHPHMQELHAQVAEAQAVLDDEDRDRRQVTKEPSRLVQQAELALLTEEPSLAALDATAKQLRAQLASAREELTTLNGNELRLAVLQRNVNLLDTDYRKYAANLEQGRIDQQLESQRMSNISVAQTASYEPRPVSPKTTLNLLLGLCAGVMGALALPLVLCQFDGSLRTPEDIQSNLDLPTLAVIPRLKAKQLVVNGKG